jgi:hypothetical protein
MLGNVIFFFLEPSSVKVTSVHAKVCIIMWYQRLPYAAKIRVPVRDQYNIKCEVRPLTGLLSHKR